MATETFKVKIGLLPIIMTEIYDNATHKLISGQVLEYRLDKRQL